MLAPVNILADDRLIRFAHKTRLPGWYFAYDGTYCCMLVRNLLCIFINFDTDEMEITVDSVSQQNLEWETPESEEEMAKTAYRFMEKYAPQ